MQAGHFGHLRSGKRIVHNYRRADQDRGARRVIAPPLGSYPVPEETFLMRFPSLEGEG